MVKPEIGNLRETFFFNQLQQNHKSPMYKLREFFLTKKQRRIYLRHCNSSSPCGGG